MLSSSSILLALTVAAIWGFNFVVIHWGGEAYPPFILTFYRFFFTAVPLIFFLKRPRLRLRDMLGYNLTLGVLYLTILFIAMRLGAPVGLSSILVQSQAAFTLVFSRLYLKDPPEIERWVGVGISFVGLLLIGNDFETIEKLLPILLIVLASMFLGFSNVLLKKVNPPDMVSYLVWGSLAPLAPLYFLGLFLDRHEPISYFFTAFSTKGFLSILYMALFSTLIGFGVWGSLLKKYSPKRVAPFALLVPFFGVASSAWLLGESLSQKQILGSVLLLIGLAVSQGVHRLFRKRKALQ